MIEPDDTRDAALQDVREASRRRVEADAASEAAARDQSAAIRAAITAGVTVVELADETGMSKARIYQIRDGRR